MKNRPVVLYGAGFRGGQTFLTLAYENVPVEAFADRDAEKFDMYFGCDVYNMKQAVEKYKELPFVVCIDDENARKKVTSELKTVGIEVYDSLDEFYQGKKDAEVDIVSCGSRATFDIAPTYLKNPNMNAFCFGIGFDFSFERELAEKYGIHVFAFDPSPEVVEEMTHWDVQGLEYYPYGLSDKDVKKVFYKPSSGQDYSEYFASWTSAEKTEMQVYRFSTLMDMFGLERLDLLKMDIEGSEFLALPNVLESNYVIDQICIETHARIFSNSVEKMRELRQLFSDAGYLLVSNGVEEQTYIRKVILQ